MTKFKKNIFNILLASFVCFFTVGLLACCSKSSDSTTTTTTTDDTTTEDTVTLGDFSDVTLTEDSTSYSNTNSSHTSNYIGDKVSLSATFTTSIDSSYTVSFGFSQDSDGSVVQSQATDVEDTDTTVTVNYSDDYVTFNYGSFEMTNTNNVYTSSKFTVYIYQEVDDTYYEVKSLVVNAVSWSVEAEEEVVSVPDDDEDIESFKYDYETEDYSYLDHTGFDGEYVHNNMSLKSDPITIYVYYKSDVSVTPVIYINSSIELESSTNEYSSSDEYYTASFIFTYDDYEMSSDTIEITSIDYTDSSNETYDETTDEILLDEDDFTFYDGIYTGMSSMFTDSELEDFSDAFNDEIKTTTGYISGYPTEDDNYVATTDSVENNKPWLVGNYDLYSESDGYEITEDAYTITGNWLVEGDIEINGLGPTDCYDSTAELNILCSDCILDGEFNFDGYSVIFTDDMDTTYTDDDGNEYNLFDCEDFDWYKDTDNVEYQIKSHYDGVEVSYGNTSSTSYASTESNIYNFSLFQKITENGSLLNCYLDYSQTEEGNGEYYQFTSIEINYGLIDNVKTGTNYVVFNNYGTVSNIEQTAYYSINSVYTTEVDYSYVSDNGNAICYGGYDTGFTVMYNESSGIVEDVEVTVNVSASDYINWFNGTKTSADNTKYTWDDLEDVEDKFLGTSSFISQLGDSCIYSFDNDEYLYGELEAGCGYGKNEGTVTNAVIVSIVDNTNGSDLYDGISYIETQNSTDSKANYKSLWYE